MHVEQSTSFCIQKPSFITSAPSALRCLSFEQGLAMLCPEAISRGGWGQWWKAQPKYWVFHGELCRGLLWWIPGQASTSLLSKCRTKLTLSVFLHWTSCAKHRPIEMCVLSSPGLKFGSFEHKVKLRAFGMGCCLFCLMDCLKGQHRDEISLRFVNVNKQY